MVIYAILISHASECGDDFARLFTASRTGTFIESGSAVLRFAGIQLPKLAESGKMGFLT